MLGLTADPGGPPGPPLDSLDAPAPCAWTPLKLVLLNVLDLCLFMPDPHLLARVSLFLMDEGSDAAVVGSGNKAMGKLGKKAIEKLMKPVEVTLEGRGLR